MIMSSKGIMEPLEPTFVSVDLESSLGVIRDDDIESEDTKNTPIGPSSRQQQQQELQQQQQQQQRQGNTADGEQQSPSSTSQRGNKLLLCQPINTDSPELDPTFSVSVPMLLDPNSNFNSNSLNPKKTRTSDTYPFANQDEEEEQHKKEDNEDDAMDESDNHNNNNYRDNEDNGASPQTTSMSFEPIPVGDEAAGDIGSMMMFMEDDDDNNNDATALAPPTQGKDGLVNKIGDWSTSSSSASSFTSGTTAPSTTKTNTTRPTTTTTTTNSSSSGRPNKKRKLSSNENGYNIVPNDNLEDENAWVPLDLSDTEVEDEDDLLSLLEEEAKESGFVLENIGDQQSFWNSSN